MSARKGPRRASSKARLRPPRPTDCKRAHGNCNQALSRPLFEPITQSGDGSRRHRKDSVFKETYNESIKIYRVKEDGRAYETMARYRHLQRTNVRQKSSSDHHLRAQYKCFRLSILLRDLGPLLRAFFFFSTSHVNAGAPSKHAQFSYGSRYNIVFAQL